MMFNQSTTYAQREKAFIAFMIYKRGLSVTDQIALRRMYENERCHLKAGVMGYMRRTGNLMPTLRGVRI